MAFDEITFFSGAALPIFAVLHSSFWCALAGNKWVKEQQLFVFALPLFVPLRIHRGGAVSTFHPTSYQILIFRVNNHVFPGARGFARLDWLGNGCWFGFCRGNFFDFGINCISIVVNGVDIFNLIGCA